MVSIYVVDDGLYHFGKEGRERGEWELNTPCYIVSALSGIKKAEQGKHLLKKKKRKKDTLNSKLISSKGTNVNANA